MLHSQFRKSLYVKGGKDVLIKRIVLDVVRIGDVILLGTKVVFNVNGEDIGNILLIATESLGNDFVIVE